MTLTRRRMLTTGTLAVAGLTGCGRKEPAKTSKVDEVTYITGFNITGQDSFVYAAIDNGYYHDAGITVTVMPGVGTRGNLQHLHAGHAQFAVIDIAGGLLDINTGGPHTDFQVFATIYQQSVSCIVALPGAGVTAPTDLAGKRIGYSEGGVNKTIFPAYAQLAGLDEKTVKWVALPPPSIRPALLGGQLDAATEVVVGRPAVEAAAKQRVTMLPYSDVLRDLYGNALGATRQLIRTNPGLVTRFRDATLKGLAWTIEHPDAAGQALAKHNPTYKAEVAAAEVRETIPYVRGSAPYIGHLGTERMNRCIALIQGIGLIKPGLNADRVIAADLTPQQ